MVAARLVWAEDAEEAAVQEKVDRAEAATVRLSRSKVQTVVGSGSRIEGPVRPCIRSRKTPPPSRTRRYEVARV